MAKNEGKYKVYDTLPPNAMTVNNYAASRGWKAHNVYMRLNRNNADFEIIMFQGINFVIPVSNN